MIECAIEKNCVRCRVTGSISKRFLLSSAHIFPARLAGIFSGDIEEFSIGIPLGCNLG